MRFTEEMLEVKQKLEEASHVVFVTKYAIEYSGKSLEEIERLTLKDKFENDAIKEFWLQIQNVDAILVLNYDKNGIKNYVGGNTLMEIGFAYVLNKKIFLLNQIPEIPFYKSEIEAVKPVIINGDLTRIK